MDAAPANETMDDTGGNASFGYDLARRLTRWTSPFDMADLEGRNAPPTHDYALDEAGNITKENVTAGGSWRQSVTATCVNGRLKHRTVKAHASIVPGDSGTPTEQDFECTPLGEEKKRTATLSTDVDAVLPWLMTRTSRSEPLLTDCTITNRSCWEVARPGRTSAFK